MKVATASLLGALLLTACGGSGSDSNEEGKGKEVDTVTAGKDEIGTIGTDPKIIVHDLSALPGMIVKGRLEYVSEGKCLVVRAQRDKEEFMATPIWPKNVETVNNDGKHGVSVPSFGAITEGDRITAAGSFWAADDKRVAEIDIPDSCRADGGFIVFNPDSFES